MKNVFTASSACQPKQPAPGRTTTPNKKPATPPKTKTYLNNIPDKNKNVYLRAETEEQTVTSPNFPYNYYNEMAKNYFITTTANHGSLIVLSFSHFRTEGLKSNRLKNDFLQVSD